MKKLYQKAQTRQTFKFRGISGIIILTSSSTFKVTVASRPPADFKLDKAGRLVH